MNSSMNSRLSALGFFNTILFAAACASSGAASAPESSSSMGNAASQKELIPRKSCSPSNTAAAAADGVLADFSGKQGQVFASVPPDYPPTTTVTQTTEGGKLVVNVNALPGDKPQFLTTTMFFDGCVDASAFTGVQFSLSGSLSGCTLQFGSVDPEHQYLGPDGPYPPQTRIAEVTSEARTITAPFRKPDIEGRPATPVDASKLAFVQWMVIVPVGSMDGTPVPPCTGKLVIDDVKLYH